MTTHPPAPSRTSTSKQMHTHALLYCHRCQHSRPQLPCRPHTDTRAPRATYRDKGGVNGVVRTGPAVHAHLEVGHHAGSIARRAEPNNSTVTVQPQHSHGTATVTAQPQPQPHSGSIRHVPRPRTHPYPSVPVPTRCRSRWPPSGPGRTSGCWWCWARAQSLHCRSRSLRCVCVWAG